jgi:hypothetical protein
MGKQTFALCRRRDRLIIGNLLRSFLRDGRCFASSRCRGPLKRKTTLTFACPGRETACQRERSPTRKPSPRPRYFGAWALGVTTCDPEGETGDPSSFFSSVLRPQAKLGSPVSPSGSQVVTPRAQAPKELPSEDVSIQPLKRESKCGFALEGLNRDILRGEFLWCLGSGRDYL